MIVKIIMCGIGVAIGAVIPVMWWRIKTLELRANLADDLSSHIIITISKLSKLIIKVSELSELTIEAEKDRDEIASALDDLKN